MLILCLQAYSQEKLLWDFRIGAGKEFYKDSEDIEEKFNVNVYNAELGLDIAIGDKFAIQPSFIASNTSLKFRYYSVISFLFPRTRRYVFQQDLMFVLTLISMIMK